MEETQNNVVPREDFNKLYAESLSRKEKIQALESELNQYKQLSTEIQAIRVENELVKRGIAADPMWVKLEANQSPSEAVDAFVEKWPHLAPQTQPKVEVPKVEDLRQPNPADMPKPLLGNQTKTNIPGPGPNGHIFGKSQLEEIKNDPSKREDLRGLYQSLLRPHNTGE